MNIKSERGQGVVVLVLLAGLVIAVVFLGLAGSMGGMKRGADAIGESVGGAIDEQLDAAAEQVAMQDLQLAVYWKGSQILTPNRHSVERHGADAYAAVDCYNRNGAFMVFENKSGDFNLLCRDDDGKVRDVMLKRRGQSNIFDFKNAYTPKDGVFARIDHWLRTTWQSRPSAMPSDAVIVIDGVAP